MKRLVFLTAGLTALLSLPAWGQVAPQLTLIHGIPDVAVDVEVEGTTIFGNFTFGGTQDLSSLAGATLVGLVVKEAGASAVVVNAGDLLLPAEGSHSIILHLDESGVPVLSVFANDTSTIGAGQGRLVFRHTAAAQVVDVLAGSAVVFGNMSNPNDVSSDVAAATISASVVPAGATEPVLAGPTDFSVGDGEVLIVYLVGSEEEASLQFLTEVITDLGTAPTGVETGNSPVGVPGVVWAGVLVVAAAIALMGLTLARKRT
jgi:hypothetical protein